VPTDAVNSVRRAAIDHSELLEVVHIDTETGKRVDDETVATSPEVLTVEAVGPKSGEPIPMSSITSPAPISPPAIKTVNSNSQVQNTLIIREVPEGVEESHIRELFTFEKCPPIHSMHLDVANCWFVTMDTTSKDDMIHVMFELRSKKFPSGESVKARLKSAVVVTSDFSPSNIRFTRTDAAMPFAPQIQGGNKKMGQGSNTGKKRKNNASKNKNNNSTAPSQNKNTKGGKNGTGSQRRNNNNNPANNGQKQNNRKQGAKQDDRSKAPQQAPPSLGEDHFPSLCTDDILNKNKIEVEKLPEQRPEDEMDKARTSSDSASTATTTSSSSSSKNHQSSQQLVGGYAAALLKAAPPVPPKPVVEQKEESSRQVPMAEKKDGKKSNDQKTSGQSKEKGSVVRKDSGKKNVNQKAAESKATPVASLIVQPPSWGGGRSFADVLRKEAAAALEAAAPQRSS